MKKKVLAALLCAAMVATSLVGCGGSEGKESGKRTENLNYQEN